LWESRDPTGEYGAYKLLFNLKDDLNETTNVATEHPDKIAELEASIGRWSKAMARPAWRSKRPPTFDVCGKTFTLPI
jgi:hypothetical protein